MLNAANIHKIDFFKGKLFFIMFVRAIVIRSIMVLTPNLQEIP